MTATDAIIVASIAVGAYLLGSIPVGLVVAKIKKGIDIRQYGSGNIGATNVARVVSPQAGAITLLADMFKGALPVGLGLLLLSSASTDIGCGLLAISAICGHLFPVYLKFKGGKGVATAAGAFLLITPGATGLSFIVFLAAFWLSKRVSVGSLTSTLCLPIAIWISRHSFPLTVFAGITTILIWWRHKDNLKRLRRGQEPTI